MIPWNARVTVIALLLVGTALFLHSRTRGEFVPPRTSLTSFPLEFRTGSAPTFQFRMKF